jgi:hypothetical protein
MNVCVFCLICYNGFPDYAVKGFSTLCVNVHGSGIYYRVVSLKLTDLSEMRTPSSIMVILKLL